MPLRIIKIGIVPWFKKFVKTGIKITSPKPMDCLLNTFDINLPTPTSKKNIEIQYRDSNLFRYIFFINGYLLGHFLDRNKYNNYKNNNNKQIFNKVIKL
jgi:hypothetical protein